MAGFGEDGGLDTPVTVALMVTSPAIGGSVYNWAAVPLAPVTTGLELEKVPPAPAVENTTLARKTGLAYWSVTSTVRAWSNCCSAGAD